MFSSPGQQCVRRLSHGPRRAPAMYSRIRSIPLAPASVLQRQIQGARSRRSRFRGAQQQDYVEAVKWFLKAADQGFAPAKTVSAQCTPKARACRRRGVEVVPPCRRPEFCVGASQSRRIVRAHMNCSGSASAGSITCINRSIATLRISRLTGRASSSTNDAATTRLRGGPKPLSENEIRQCNYPSSCYPAAVGYRVGDSCMAHGSGGPSTFATVGLIAADIAEPWRRRIPAI